MNIDIDISEVVLTIDDLTLRAFKESDLNDLYEYAKVDGVGQMAGWLPHENIEASKMVLDFFIKEKKTFAIVKDNKVIGSIGIEEYNEKLKELADKKGRELGFVLSKDYWGLGIMPKACQRVIKYLFEECDLDFLICVHSIINKQSARVQEKLGFKYYTKETREYPAGIQEGIVNILYKEDYFK